MKESGLWKKPRSVLFDLASLGSSQSSPRSTLDSGPALDAPGKPGGSSWGLIKRSSWKHRPSFVIVKIQDPGSRISKFTRRMGGRGGATLTTRSGSWILDFSTLAKYGQLLPDFAQSSGSWILDSGNACQRWQVESFLRHGNPGSRTQKRVDRGGATLNLRGQLHQLHENPESRIQDRR